MNGKTSIYSFEIDNLLDSNGGLWHDTTIRVVDTNYEKAYSRAMEIAPKVFPDGTKLRYTVSVGTWDDSLPENKQYSASGYKYFRKSLPPATLEDYNTATGN